MNKCCNKQKLNLDRVYSKREWKIPHYELTCLSCNHIEIVKLSNLYWYSNKGHIKQCDFFIEFISKIIKNFKCKIFGHKKAINILRYHYNTIMGLKVDAEVKNIQVICPRCGKSYGSMIQYDRLIKVQNLFKNSK